MLKKMFKRATLFSDLGLGSLVKVSESPLSPGPMSPMREDLMLKIFFKNSFEFTILISAFLTVFHSPDLHAETSLSSERKVDAIAFAPSMVWLSYLKNQLQSSKLDLDQQIDNFNYSTPDNSIRFVSERVNFSTHFESKVVASSVDSATIQLSLKLDSAHISVSNFNLEALIQRDLGFGSATLKLDMHCDGIELELKNQNSAMAEIKIEQGKISLSQLSWDLRGSQIETKLVGCKEISGFDQLLKDQIQQNIEKGLVLETLQQLVNQRLNVVVHQKIAKTLTEVVEKIKVSQNQKYQFDDKNNLWVFSGNGLDQSFTPEEMARIKLSQKPALLIKKQSLESFAKDSINDILKANVISSKAVDGINRLTCSRFIQTFVWPSLKSLGKCFEMKIQTQVQSLSITNLSDLSLRVQVGSWASGEGRQVAYFESGLEGRLMNLFVQMRSFKGQSNPDFVRWSGRSKRISTSMIQPSLEELLNKSVSKLKENAILKLIQKNAKLNLIGADTALIEINL